MNLFTLFLYSLYGFIIVRAVPNDDSDLIKEWNSFKTKFSKSYSSKTEEKRRFEIFKEHKRKFDGHNERYRRGEESFKMGINQFGDLTDDEVIRLTTRIQYDDYLKQYEKDKIDIFTIPTGFIAPKTLDWRKKGAVTPTDDSDLIKEWNSFMTEFSKSYGSETEEKHRFEIFKENKRAIDRHNEKYRKGEESFEMGINQFGDLSNDELNHMNCEKPEDYSN